MDDSRRQERLNGWLRHDDDSRTWRVSGTHNQMQPATLICFMLTNRFSLVFTIDWRFYRPLPNFILYQPASIRCFYLSQLIGVSFLLLLMLLSLIQSSAFYPYWLDCIAFGRHFPIGWHLLSLYAILRPFLAHERNLDLLKIQFWSIDWHPFHFDNWQMSASSQRPNFFFNYRLVICLHRTRNICTGQSMQ